MFLKFTTELSKHFSSAHEAGLHSGIIQKKQETLSYKQHA